MNDGFSGKIIQIMPAPAGMFAVYDNGDGDGGEYRTPVVALGLNDIGNVVLLELDCDGSIIEVGSCDDQLRIECPGP